MKLRGFGLAVCLSMFGIGTASAQDYAGVIYDAMKAVAHQECLIGKPSEADSTGGEASGPAQEAMVRYWKLASAADSIDVTDIFQASGKATWLFNGAETPVRSGKVTDVFARAPGSVLVEEPLALVRAKLGDTAQGVWEIRNPSGEAIGYYLVDFRRKSNWKPLRLELVSPAGGAPAVKPYCYMPGDIEAAKVPLSDRQVAKISKKARPAATCAQGADCAEKWARARQWVADNSAYPLIHFTDTALITSGPARASLAVAVVVTLDPPGADKRQVIRFRAWCGNYFMCFPKPSTAHTTFAQMLVEPVPAVGGVK